MAANINKEKQIKWEYNGSVLLLAFLIRGKARMPHNKAPTKEEREMIRGEGEKIKFIVSDFKDDRLWGFWQGRRR